MHLRIIRIHGMEKYVIESRNQKCVAPSGLSHLVQGWLVPKGHAKTFPIYGALHLGMHLFSPIRWNEAGDASGRGEGSENASRGWEIVSILRSFIPTDRSFATTWNLGLQDLLSPASPLAHAAGNILGMRVFPPKYHRYGRIFYRLIKQ